MIEKKGEVRFDVVKRVEFIKGDNGESDYFILTLPGDVRRVVNMSEIQRLLIEEIPQLVPGEGVEPS